MKKLMAVRRRQTGSAGAFTLVELLVVLGVAALLATVLLSAAFTSKERVMRADCVSNLKQISVAIGVYSTEYNDYLPLRSWKNCLTGGNPWQTYEACRMIGFGTRVIAEGPYGFGQLYFSRGIADPKTFYCPATVNSNFLYRTYSEPGWPWPSIPPDYDTEGNPYVRCGYNYYAQSRNTEVVSSSAYGAVLLPELKAQSLVLVSPNSGDPPQPVQQYPVWLKITDVNPKKSMVTDMILTTANLSHQATGSATGVNALFPDGHVAFTDAATHNKRNSRQPFDPTLWDPFSGTGGGNGAGNDPVAFRIIVNGLVP